MLSLLRIAGSVLLVVCIGSASAAPILMPAGSTVWMKFETNQAPIEDGNDAAGSNRPGVAPPNGIPMTTATSGSQSTTGYAEILPDRVRTFTTGWSQFMHASFRDTYTVGGTAAGAFDITVRLRVTGEMRSVPSANLHILFGGNVQAKIGTFNIDPLLSNEDFRVALFDPTTEATTGAHDLLVQGSIPVDITASYTKTGVSVGDVFDIGYQVRSAAARGEIDLRNTGAISFELPPGVSLTSALALSIPEPTALAMVAVLGIARTARRKGRSMIPG